MISVPHHDVLEELYASSSTLVVRARRERDGQPVILKLPRGVYPAQEELARLRREHAVLQALSIPEVVGTHGLERLGGSLALVLEDAGGEPLDAVIRRGALEPVAFLRVAIAVTRAVRAIHARRIIHKDLKPQHLLIDSSGAVRILDFGLSTDLAQERCAPADPDALEGTLAYMAPEQTGRMNHPVDRRSDLYSLGVSLFELATGQLPFGAADPLELVHCHVARSPPRADAVNPRVPAQVAAIVAKLLAKAPEDRYQGAAGLLADLERCLASLEATGAIAPFELGADDGSDVLQLPQRLYGRDGALGVLQGCFDRALGGIPQLLLLGGPSGIGKSALVLQLRRQLVRRGHLVVGKFDQLGASEPFAAVAAACRELVRAVLASPPAALAEKRRALLEALGPNARLVVELVPELELVVGPQPAPPPLAPNEARNRFEQTFEDFVAALVTPDEPLVLFLDDLQWADGPSLRLVSRVFLLRRPILVIGAYRADEVWGLHPLLLEVEELGRRGVAITRLALEPLGVEPIAELLSDTLGRPAPELRPLAEALRAKTRGNPFHLGQFLHGLVREGLLCPEPGGRRWSFDLDAVERHPAAANVVDLLLERLRALSPRAQAVLGLAACIGHEADSGTLARVSELEPRALTAGIAEALREGALVPLDDRYRYLEQADGGLSTRLGFSHDRVQQAAYALVHDPQRSALHLRIGRLLRASLPDGAGDELLFPAVQQMNRGASHLQDAAEREWLIRSNLRCARRALATAAVTVAQEHATRVLALLGRDPWAAGHPAAVAARMVQAECEYVAGAPERALEVLGDVAAHARETADRVAAANLRASVLVRFSRFLEATRASAEAMRLLGLEVPEPDDEPALARAVEAELGAVRAALAGRELAALASLPELTDPLGVLELRTLAGTIPSAYHCAPRFMALVVLKATRLTLERGATDLTSFVLLQYALVHLALTGDRAEAYRIGLAGLEVGRARANLAALGPAHFLFAAFVSHWVDPLARSLDHFALGLRRSLELGDRLHAAFCIGLNAQHLLRSGAAVPELRASLAEARAQVDGMGDLPNRDYVDVALAAAAAFAGECAPFGPAAEGGPEDPRLAAAVSPVVLTALRAAQAWTRLLAGAPEAALAAAAGAEPFVGLLVNSDLRFFAGLSHAALARGAEGEARARHVQAVEEAWTTFEGWARGSAGHHAHRRDLLGAALAELRGEAGRALDLHEAAIAGARAQGLVQEDALACELGGEFHLRGGRTRLARAALADAVSAYRAWGAEGKVRQLLDRHAGLALDGRAGPPAVKAERPSSSRRPAAQGEGGGPLDLEAMLRATQAITGELEAGKLLDRLLRILVESAGAQRGVLVAPHGDELVVEAERLVEPDEVHLRGGAALLQAEVPEQVIRYVARTRGSVVLGDAAADAGGFADDPYLRAHRPRSVLCLALLYEGELGAVVYLENRAAAHAFGPARVARIRFLAAQAASALANSRLYEELQASSREMEQRVRERTLELSQRNAELRGVLDAVGQGLLTLDRAGRVVGERSAATAALLGPIAEGEPFAAALARADAGFAQAFAAAFAEVVRGAGPLPALLARVPRRLGAGARRLDLELRPVGGAPGWERMLVVISDVTGEEQRKRLEVELRHAQKLEAVGQLAAGIAHEINTPTQFVGDSLAFVAGALKDVLGLLGTYRRALPALSRHADLKPLAEEIAGVEAAADVGFLEENLAPAFARANDGLARISTLVGAMKEFAHPGHREKEWADLNRALRNALVVARNEYKYVAEVEEDLGDLPLVRCHLSDLNQVFLNLLVNAAHAVREVVAGTGGKGRIRVRSAREDGAVRISIEDSGCGIPEEIRGRVFEPFFTTRPVGQGAGQGLAIARSIVVERHGGTLDFETEVGKGTTFTIVLPVRGTGAEPAGAGAAPPG